ncbi:MAG: GyrI-like domain-containing protein [Armatimonadota bacterium]
MQIEVIERPQVRAAALRHVGPYPQIGPVFDKLCGIAVVSGWFSLPEACTLMVTYDCPDTVPATELRSDAAVVVGPDSVLPVDVDELIIPGGRYVRGVYIGPYSGLADAWREFSKSVRDAGYHVIGMTAMEVYVSDPRSCPVDELRTELFVPLNAE